MIGQEDHTCNKKLKMAKTAKCETVIRRDIIVRYLAVSDSSSKMTVPNLPVGLPGWTLECLSSQS